MKSEKTNRELKEESIADLRKGKLYLQNEWLIAPNNTASQLLGEAIQETIDVIKRIEKELGQSTI